MPEKGVQRVDHSDILSYEEIQYFAETAVACGIKKIRLTGGEPLVRPGIVNLVEKLAETDGIDEISMTTNAVLLEELAGPLAEAGLSRVNISLDTLKPEKFCYITRRSGLDRVFAGIDAAKRAGLTPIKINTVVIRGFNDEEIIELAEWALKNSLNIRFIEFMPLNKQSFPFNERYISSAEIRDLIFSHFPGLKPGSVKGNGPAVSWSENSFGGSIGFIEAVSHSFCAECNRLRLTADGKLKPCLFSNDEVDLVPVLRGAEQNRRENLYKLILRAVEMKPESHGNFKSVGTGSRCMNEIGG